MEENEHPLHALFERVESYFSTSVTLLKLQALQKSAEFSTNLAVIVTLGGILFFFILLFSIGLAFLAGELLGKVYFGFFAVCGLFLILFFLFYLMRKTWIKNPVSNSIIRFFLTEKQK